MTKIKEGWTTTSDTIEPHITQFWNSPKCSHVIN